MDHKMIAEMSGSALQAVPTPRRLFLEENVHSTCFDMHAYLVT